jgi:hypothetical protein
VPGIDNTVYYSKTCPVSNECDLPPRGVRPKWFRKALKPLQANLAGWKRKEYRVSVA